MTKHVSRLFRGESGSILLEATFALGTLLLVLIGIMEFSRALYADIFIGYAAHSASRYAMVRGSSWSPTMCSIIATGNCMASASDVANYVRGIAPLGIDTSSNLNTSSIWPGITASGTPCAAINGPASPGCLVQVRITYSFHFALPLVSSAPLILQSSSIVTISQ